MCFKWKMDFDDKEDGKHVWTRAHLLLGALAGTIHPTDPARANTIIDRLHGMVEIHDPWKHRQLRSALTEEEYSSHLHEKATILGALGNAGMDRSYDYFLSYMNSSEAPSVLKRTSMSALKNYDHEKAAHEILRVAIEDPDGHVRYAAALDYLGHPRAAKLLTAQQQINDRNVNQTNMAEEREKRGLSDTIEKLFKGFYFKLETPSYDWHKRIGSSKIGASMGLVIRNKMELDLKPLSGGFYVDAVDMAYAKVHIGVLGVDYKFLEAGVCFKGKAEYEFNIFQEFNFEEVFRLVKLFDRVINQVVGNIKDTIIRFKQLLGRSTGSIDGIFQDIIEAVENLPNQVREFRVKAKEFTRKTGKYTDLPPVVENVKQVVQRVSTLISDVKVEVMEFYNSIADVVSITLPWAAQQIENGVTMVVSSIKRLFKTPKTAIEDIFKGVTMIKFAVTGVIQTKERIEKALLFNEDKTLHWMNLREDLDQISDDISVATNSLLELNDWAVQQVESTDFTRRFFGVNITAARQQIVAGLREIMNGLLGPVQQVYRIPNTFLSAFEETVDLIKSIKDGYNAIKNGYDEAKSLIEQIFGSKSDQDFPRMYLESDSCGDGFYPSTGQGRYAEQGVLLEAAAGQQIGAPFSGIIRRSGINQVTIKTDSMEKLEVIIDNVNLLTEKEMKRVFKGTLIGTVSSSSCQPNHIHLAIRNTESGGLVDPTRFMEKRDMIVPSWEQECADYNLYFRKPSIQGLIQNVVVQIGKFAGSIVEDLSPARIFTDISDLLSEFPDVSLDLPDISLDLPDISLDLPDISLDLPDISLDLPDISVQVPDISVQVPDISVQVPDISVQVPDISVQIPDISVQIPDVSLQVPDVSVQVPDVSVQVFDIPVQVPDISVQVPDTSLEIPDVSVQIPDVLLQVPDVPLNIPGVSLQVPDISVQVPDISLQIPDVSVQMPDISVQVPDVLLQVPDVSVQVPDVSVQLSDVSLQVPYISLQVPDVSVQVPDISVQVSNVSVQVPDVSLQVPNISVQVPDFSLQIPDVSLPALDISLQVPDILVQIPDISLQIPDISVQIPDISVQIPDVSLQVPVVSVQVPNISVQVPNISLQIPDVSLQIPDVSLQVPDISLELPDFSLQVPDISVQVPDFSVQIPDVSLKLRDVLSEVPNLGLQIGQAKDFLSSLDLPDLNEIVSLPNFDFRSLKLSKVFESMVSSGLSDAKARLNQTVERLLESLNLEKTSCPVPETLDNAALKRILRGRGNPATGSRDILLKNYRKPENRCPELRQHLPENMHCFFEENCLGVTCCADLNMGFTRQAISAFAVVDPCRNQMTLGLGPWRKTFNITSPSFAAEDVGPFEENLQILDIAQVMFKYKITKIPGGVELTFQVTLCSDKKDHCLPFVSVFSRTRLQLGVCQTTALAGRRKRSIADLAQLSIGEIEKLIDDANMLADDVTDVKRELRTLYRDIAVEAIDNALHRVFKDQFTSLDKKLSHELPFGPYSVNFFTYKAFFTLGPIPMVFRFGAGGSYGMVFSTDVRLLSMQADVSVTPSVGAQVWGSLGVWLGLFEGRLQLRGYIMTTSFPCTAELQFTKFPLDVGIRMDMNLVPLRLELRGILELTVNLKFTSFTRTVINKLLWQYSTPTIHATIFSINSDEPDTSPPDFKVFDSPFESGVARRAAQTTACTVQQQYGRDYTEPAFLLELAVEDDRSEVDLTYSVGVTRGGSDQVLDQPLGGFTTIVAQILRGGVPLYFTVTASNSAQQTSLATCELPTYDVTLPGGRVTPDFISTSHPNILRSSAVVLDDSALVNQKEAIGFGRKVYGDQVVPWKEINITKIHVEISIGHDPHDTRNLEYFASPRLGRVLSKPHHVAHYPYAQKCARDCLALPPTKCLSFNYDYGDGGRCELLEEIEGHGAVMYTDRLFHNFERLGIGHAVEVGHEDLNLIHNQLYYYNLFLNNTVGYTNILTSPAVIVDFVPPSPGPLSNISLDETNAEVCVEFVPDEWEGRCVEQTPLPNHRAIIDGEGSGTVFNGNKPLQDLRYFRPNTYVTANWDGFHDNETGIFGYTWTVGTYHCQDDVHPHKDPHSHLYGEDEWTHQGLAYPLELDDGFYHVSVRALNKVEFGGPLATTVCHTTPYVIDTTPPFVNHVKLISYDEVTFELVVEYNVSDPLSNIREVDIGLGKSHRDVFIKDWHRHDNLTHVVLYYRIPDGIPTWIKVRAINNVDLRTASHAPRPLIVDLTPPVPGTVHDGETYSRDRAFQAVGNRVCASWKDLHDEESGIGFYLWGVGTSVGADDIVSFHELPHTQHAACAELNRTLQHGGTYYSTLVAFNLGHAAKNVSVSSDGVLYDATPPEEGWVKDGLDPNHDVTYSSETASVSALWEDFRDPESDIADYEVTVWRKHSNNGNSSADTAPHVIHEATSVGKEANSINWHHFHLHDGDFVYVVVNASNGAGSVVVTESDGFTLDTSAPEMRFIGDGSQPGTDLQYSPSTTDLSVNWEFDDVESGIDHYKLAVFQYHGGSRLQIYPAQKNNWVTVEGSAAGWTSSAPLTLVPGARYSVRVSAVNGAGLTTTHDTDGVIIDPTPPSNLYVAVDVMPGELEELHDGYVLHTDLSAILVSWRATDGESKVMAYWAALGTSPGGKDVMPFENMGADRSAYINNLQLQLYDEATGSPVYYVTVKAQNGAGAISTEVVSSPIKVVPGDKAGVVVDGPRMTDGEADDVSTVDVDYQLHTGTVTVRFRGFESARHGIVHYEWAVGTAALWDDVQPYSSAGIVLYDDNADMEGLGGEGHAQSLRPLRPGQLYYTTVRAITGTGNILESASDGFTVDVTPPQVDFLGFGVTSEDEEYAFGSDVSRYQLSADYITAEWGYREEESDVVFATFAYGTYPGSHDVYNRTVTSQRTSVPNSLVHPSSQGRPNILSLTAINSVGLRTVALSASLTVDSTPPVAGDVMCPRHLPGTDELRCTWHGFRDEQSHIDHFRFGVGTEEGDDSVFPFTRVSGKADRFKAKGFAGQFLRHQESYYATVIAYNAVSGKTSAYSAAIVIDDTPPVTGTVAELDSIYHADLEGDDSDGRGKCDNQEDCQEMDAVCQASVTQVTVAWQPFTDPETPITRYEVAVGTVPGGAELHSFRQVPDHDARFFVVKNLDLSDIRQVFVTVRGHNAAGLSSVAVSDGVYISKISAGLPPLTPLIVSDGDSHRGDIDFQSHNDEISAHWDFSGDPCPSARTEWSVVRLDGLEIWPLTELSPGADSATSDEFDLRDGETYYTVVRATNQLGYSYSVRSDGVTVKLEPLVPGVVRDGPIIGFDLSHQQSVSSLSANWDSFGKDYGLGDDAAIDGETVENRDHQIIDHYEVAVGTDRRYPSTRTNIRPFINVGQNKTVTFEHLQLIPRTGIYYVTVRAVSLASSTTEVTSNGIRVGFGGDIISHGEVQVPRYISSDANITVAWSDFEFTMPILLYQWGITTNRTKLDQTDCIELQNFHEDGYAGNSEEHAHLFDIYPLTKVGRNTMVQHGDLDLQHGHTYHVVVVATDEAAQCAMALADVTIDTSPPEDGHVFVGSPGDMNVMYTAMADRMEVLWDGYHDNTSGIARFEVALLSDGDYQSQGGERRTAEVDFIPVTGNESSYMFVDIDLKPDTPYYVTFRAVNRADLETESTTPPILLDRRDPVSGDVMDGFDFESDATHQSSLSEMKGVTLHLPNPVGDPCPKRSFPMDEMYDSWSTLHMTGLWGVSGKRRILFDPEQLSFDEDEGLSIRLTRDIEYERMMSGAYSTEVDGSRTGEYEMDIIAASGDLQAVTSVVFWNGPEGVVGDHNGMSLEEDAIFPSSNENCSCCQSGNDSTGDTGNVTASNVTSDCNCTCTSPTSEPQTSTEEPTSTTEPSPDWTIEKDDVEGETPGMEPDSNDSPYASCGLQLHPETVNSPSYVGLWCRFANGTEAEQGETVKLDFDPSAAWHTYTLQFMEEKIFATKVDRSVRLYIDGQLKAVLTGIPALSPTTQLILSTWNKHDWIPELVDPFEPPTTTASFRSVSLPPDSSRLCLHGKPFRNGDHAVVRFEAGVGSAKLLDDVASFREVAKPCIPCSARCDVLGCDPDCDEDQTYVHQVHLTGMHLSPVISVQDSNTSVQAVYYLTVRAVAGSGRAAIASSNGIYIDVTPPVIENLFHVDLSWSPDEPTSYQGDNSTIAVYWEAYDTESEVVECQWAVGTSPGDTDVQNFTSVGPDKNLVYSEKLEGKLINRQTYYVTVRLVNGAGLVSEKTTSGVTVLLDPPDTSSSNTTTSCEQTVEKSSTLRVVGVDLCGDQEKIDIAWTRLEDDSVNNYEFSVGTSEDNRGDVIPQTQVGYNESGWVQVLKSELSFGRSKVNISDLRSRADELSVKTHSKFHVEPGRTLFTRLTACHAGHKCADIAVKKRTIMRAQDKLLTFQNGSTDDIELVHGHESENTSVIIARSQGQDPGVFKPGAVAAGVLTDRDVSMTYTSGTPYITNPAFTMHQTDRFLKNRVRKGYGQSFFLASIGGDEVDAPLTVTVNLNESVLLRDEIPRVVFWEPESEIWRDVHGTCTGNPGAVDYNWDEGHFTVGLCSTTAAQGHRSRRSEQRYFSGSSQFAVVIINGTFQNEPPVLLSPLRMSMGEDEGTLTTQLVARDPEDDDLVFRLNEQENSDDLVELDEQGTLRYKPALDFSGSKEIPITISESRVDSNPLLSTTLTIVIDVGDENDTPQPFVVHEGEEKLQGAGILRLTVEENHPENVDFEVLRFVAGSYDVDAYDAMKLHIKEPSNGTIGVGKHVKNITFKEPNCTMSVEAKIREWTDV
ncbi:uncharacterized protein [Branchiostoma lanceolatum]|uniref:uncharacterized protein n=1 Tax=Branchiostoma lanceolatum TaxID=7740 RepID=UPI00345170C3